MSSETYILARVDESTRTLTLVSIPGNLAVSLSDGKTHPLYDAYGIGGDEALVKAVSSFAGVGIPHLVKTNEEGIRSLVDLVGGIGMTLPESVDDPYAGSIYLEAGEQVLDAESSLVALRASNYAKSSETQASVRTSFAYAMALRLLEAGGLDFAHRARRNCGQRADRSVVFAGDRFGERVSPLRRGDGVRGICAG